MPKSVEKVIVHGMGKVDGKVRTWIVAVFNDIKTAKPYVALLKLAHGAGDEKSLIEMDPNAPRSTDGKFPSEVKFSASTAPYSPEPAGLDDDLTLG